MSHLPLLSTLHARYLALSIVPDLSQETHFITADSTLILNHGLNREEKKTRMKYAEIASTT